MKAQKRVREFNVAAKTSPRNHIGPINVCDVQSETLSDGSKVWNVEFQRVIVGCRTEKEALYLNSQVKDLIANCSIWVTA